MANATREYELIVLGATGYTGKLVAEWVTAHLPSDLKWAVAGRNAKKLQAVVDGLKEQNPDRKLPGEIDSNYHTFQMNSSTFSHCMSSHRDRRPRTKPTRHPRQKSKTHHHNRRTLHVPR